MISMVESTQTHFIPGGMISSYDDLEDALDYYDLLKDFLVKRSELIRSESLRALRVSVPTINFEV